MNEGPKSSEGTAPEEQEKLNDSAQPEEQKVEATEMKEEGKKETLPRLEEMTFVPKPPAEGGRVCITYGRDTIMNKQVVSLIRELGINPLVMQDKQNAQIPIAQFVTAHPDIAFVIAILSADDWVYDKKGKPKDALLYASQSVVFHLGFWIGRLGRNRVFALYYDQQSFRWPTEHFDLIYTPLDKRNLWKKELVRRLKECGIKTDNTEL